MGVTANNKFLKALKQTILNAGDNSVEYLIISPVIKNLGHYVLKKKEAILNKDVYFYKS